MISSRALYFEVMISLGIFPSLLMRLALTKILAVGRSHSSSKFIEIPEDSRMLETVLFNDKIGTLVKTSI